jgi:glycylpeptide N-tetradecanoyltransferase
MARYVKIYKMPEETSIPGLRPMAEKDVSAVHKKLNKYLSQYKMHIQFSEKEIRHFLIPRDNVIESFVV